jgi:hypothetical protein
MRETMFGVKFTVTSNIFLDVVSSEVLRTAIIKTGFLGYDFL